MNISYYTIDDLRLPAKRLLRKGWTMERFPTLEEALARYRALPASGIKALGLTDGTHVLEEKVRIYWPQTTVSFPCGAMNRRRRKPLSPVSPPWDCATEYRKPC